MEPTWPTVRELSKQTGYHPEHIRRLIRQGRVEAKKLGLLWFVNPESMAAYIKQVGRDERGGPRSGSNEGL